MQVVQTDAGSSSCRETPSSRPTIVESFIGRSMESIREFHPDLPDSVFASREAGLRSRPVADSIPMIADLYATQSDMIWVLDWSEPGAGTLSATAVSPTRGLVGRLIMPTSGQPVAFDLDRVVFREIDSATGLISLVVYRLTLP